MTARLKVAHIITTLDVGDAEIMLYRVLTSIDRSEIESSVICLTGVGPIGRRIAALGIPVDGLGLRRYLGAVVAIPRLVRWLRKMSPDVVQTWMYHADLAGGLAARVAGGLPVCWCVQSG